VGRRGPAQASFTNKELREILNLPEVECHLLPSDVLSLNEASKVEISKERGKKRMIDLFTKVSCTSGISLCFLCNNKVCPSLTYLLEDQ